MATMNGRLRATLVLLLLASSALFVVGAAIERHQATEGTATSPTSPATGEGGGSEEGGEGGTSETHPTSGESSSTSSERLLGIDPEAPWVVALGVSAAAVLAVAVWFRPSRGVLIAVIAFGLVLATLDLREMVHQIEESRTSLVAIASTLAVTHLAVAGVAASALTRRQPLPRAA